jgi:glutamate racemase
MQIPERPIGIFDSGVGGLTVVRAIKDILPQETIYYIGDTANIPYGEKSTEEIQTRVQKIVDYLLFQKCKLIVIACATATVAVAEMLIKQIPPEIPILNVINPVIDHIVKIYAKKKLGLIATQYTVNANYYSNLLKASKADIELVSLATPLLVPMIEADVYEPHILEAYIHHAAFKDIAGMILGCTHYWLIKNHIKTYYPPYVALINGAELLALQLREVLFTRQLMNGTTGYDDRFMVTSSTTGFQKILVKLFGEITACEELELY